MTTKPLQTAKTDEATTCKRQFTRETLLEAVHGPFADVYWYLMEESGNSPPAGSELCSITERGPEEEMLEIAIGWLAQYEDIWGVRVVDVFHAAGWLGKPQDTETKLFRLFMQGLGHGISICDDVDDQETLHRVSAKLGFRWDKTPLLDDIGLWSVASESVSSSVSDASEDD